MRYRLVYARHFQELEESADTLDEALKLASDLLEYESGFPLDLFDNKTLLASNRGSFLLDSSSVLLSSLIWSWEREHGK